MDYAIDYQKFFLASTRIAESMERDFPNMVLRCSRCGHTEPNNWEFMLVGWPKCHGQTMILEGSDD